MRRPKVHHWQWIGVAVGLAGFGLVAWDDLAHGPLYHADAPVNDWVSARAAAGWPTHSVGETISWPGAYLVGIAAVVVCAVAWWVWGERRVALWAVAGSVAASLLVSGVKAFVERARPTIGAPAHSYSFPSGHTMGATAVLGILILMGTQVHLDRYRIRGDPARHAWAASIATWVFLTLAVGAARVAAQDHWMTDVLASWFLGIAIVGLVLRGAGIPRPAHAPDPGKPAEVRALLPGSGQP